jgi:hypothetical protein
MDYTGLRMFIQPLQGGEMFYIDDHGLQLPLVASPAAILINSPAGF